jgi:hypothetical protein
MLWLYGVAWHQPMAESIAWARTTIADAWPSASTLSAGFTGGGGRISGKPPTAASTTSMAKAPSPVVAAPRGTDAAEPPASQSASVPIDSDVATLFAERRAKIAVVSAEGPRMLRAGNWKRAAELCRAWTELELANADAYRCLGQALQAQGYHQDAIAAFRRAKQYDPADRSLDAAIDRSQRGIVADFLNRYRR